MQRSRLRLAIYASAALVAVGGGAVAAFAATGPSTKAASGLTAVFSTDSNWGSGYQARYTITNNTGATVNGWTLAFGLPSSAKLGSFWDATITTAGSTETAKNPGYAPTIASGATATFGFIVAGSGAPTNCTINGASCAGGGGTVTTPPTTTPTKAPTTTPTTAPTTKPTTAPPTKPTTAPPTTSAPGGGGNVLVAPYVDMGLLSNGSTTLAQLGSSGNLKSFSLAFVTSVGCKASWFNAFDPRQKQFADQIAAVRAAGGDVKVSFGGATGIELAQACTSTSALQAEYQAVVSAY
jgi:hypothetical protein